MGIGLCASSHLDGTLKNLEEFGKSDTFRKASGIFGLLKVGRDLLCFSQSGNPKCLFCFPAAQLMQLMHHEHYIYIYAFTRLHCVGSCVFQESNAQHRCCNLSAVPHELQECQNMGLIFWPLKVIIKQEVVGLFWVKVSAKCMNGSLMRYCNLQFCYHIHILSCFPG